MEDEKLTTPSAPTATVEQEFLCLARDWLLCRLFVFGGICPEKLGQYNFEEWLVGMFSYAEEMRLVVEESRRLSGSRLQDQPGPADGGLCVIGTPGQPARSRVPRLFTDQ